MTMQNIPDSWLVKDKKAVTGRVIIKMNGVEARLAGTYPHSGKLMDIQKLDGTSGETATPDQVDFTQPMSLLKGYRNNFFRHWVIFYPNFFNGVPDIRGCPTNFKDDCSEKDLSVSFTSAGVPWAERYSPFLYHRALKKWDLWRYNEDYFLKLNKMVKQARDYGQIVQLTLFDRTGTAYTSCDKCLRWPHNPWNAKNNVNGVINTTNETGVAEFYNRDLVGHIRYRDPSDRDHWPNTGPPALIVENITLGELQDEYVRRVLQSTAEFPNVCYEIMNEPEGGDEGSATVPPARVKWANEIVKVIHDYTGGKRLIFYNDMTGFTANDVFRWRGLSNYDYLDGVIFHGDIQSLDPDARNSPVNATVRQEKILQVSSDGHPDGSYDYNFNAANNAFQHHMIFQAETNTDDANKGIQKAMTALLDLPRFVGKWWKLTEQSTPNYFPHLAHVVNADGTLIDLNQDTDQLTMTGRVVSILGNKWTSWNELSQRAATFTVEFPQAARTSPPVSMQNVTLLQYTRDNIVQVFRRLEPSDPLYRFYFKWETVETPFAPYLMFIYPDKSVGSIGSLVTHRVNDFVKNNEATIKDVSPTQIRTFSKTNQRENLWNYTFSPNGEQLTLVRVPTLKDDTPIKQVYKRML